MSRAGQPVLRAEVEVYLQILTDDSRTIDIGPIPLYDNGNGDPDILGDDGVYSRYLLEYPAVGRYSFSIHVTGIKNKTVVLFEGESSSKLSVFDKPNTCCGSHINLKKYKLINVDPFKRIKLGLARNFIQVPNSHSADQIAPSKIQDLSIQVLAESTRLLATWTAPGNNSDTGSVSGYNFLFSSSIAELLDPQTRAQSLFILWREDKVGTRTRYQFQFKHFDKDFYFGVVGLDSANNSGQVSNLVRVLMPGPMVVHTGAGWMQDQEDTSEWKMLTALCGSLLLLAISLLLGIIYFLRMRPKDIPPVQSDLTDTITHCKMPDIVSGVSPVFTPPPASLPDSSPSYWSATQILTMHEQRALALSYGPWPYSHRESDYSGTPAVQSVGVQTSGSTRHGTRTRSVSLV